MRSYVPSDDDQPPRMPASASRSNQQPEVRTEEQQAMLYCPVCNQRLAAQRCKLICERCGYYMSCADYY